MTTIFALAGCESVEDTGGADASDDIECHSLRTEDALPSATQTFAVAWDPVGGRVLVTALGLPFLSVIDPVAGKRVAAIAVGPAPAMNPRLVADDSGIGWVGSLSSPELVRVDVDSGLATQLSGFSGVNWLVAMPSGVVLPQAGRVVRIATTGEVVAEAGVSAATGGARVGEDVVVLEDAAAVWLDGGTLAETRRCDLPFAAKFVAGLPDGNLVVSDGDRLARLDCGGGEAGSWPFDADITSLIADGTSVWALDRVSADDPTVGTAWRIDVTGTPAKAFPTAKNTGYGAIVEGVLWANAEGSSEVMAFRLADGARLAEVSTGTSAADVVVDSEGGVVVTGRLSALVGRIDDGETLRTEPLEWPWAPTLAGDRLVLLDHLHGTLASLDAHHLDDLIAFDLGLGPNELLTFDSLAFAEDRGTFLVAESQADVLLEVDLDAGELVHRWDLGGPLVTDTHLASQLELQLDGDVALLARTSDGRLTRLDLATGDRREATLTADHLKVLRSRRQTRATQLAGGFLWLGPLRIDADTLDVVDLWPDIGGILAPWPGAEGEWLAITANGKALAHVNTQGELGPSLAWFDEPQPGTVAALDPDGQAAWVTRSYEGRVCRVPLKRVDEGAATPPAY